MNSGVILLIGGQKGGSGKSTIAVNIAARLAQEGKDVVILDADRQGTSSAWAADREKVDAPKIACVQRYDNIRETALDLGGRYDVVVIDAAGRDSRELRTGMTGADILVTPFKPSQPDLDTLSKMEEIVINAKDINPNLKVYALLTMAPTNPMINEIAEAVEFLTDYPEFSLMDSIVRERKVYRDAMSEGLGVTEMKNPKASTEISGLVREIWLSEEK
jgi:chromosome partitioning protein